MEKDLHARYPTSKANLRLAFLMLLTNTAYEKITISDIALKAGYTRQTFYFHYQSKESLLQEIVEDLADGLISLMTQVYKDGIETLLDNLTEEYHPIFIKYFNYVRKHSKAFRILLNPLNGADFYLRFSKAMASFQQKNMIIWEKNYGDSNDDTTQALYNTAFGSFLSGLCGWVANGMTPDEKTMAIYHTKVWLSYIYLLKDKKPDGLYHRLIEKMKKKGLSLPDKS